MVFERPCEVFRIQMPPVFEKEFKDFFTSYDWRDFGNVREGNGRNT